MAGNRRFPGPDEGRPVRVRREPDHADGGRLGDDTEPQPRTNPRISFGQAPRPWKPTQTRFAQAMGITVCTPCAIGSRVAGGPRNRLLRCCASPPDTRASFARTLSPRRESRARVADTAFKATRFVAGGTAPSSPPRRRPVVRPHRRVHRRRRAGGAPLPPVAPAVVLERHRPQPVRGEQRDRRHAPRRRSLARTFRPFRRLRTDHSSSESSKSLSPSSPSSASSTSSSSLR